MSTLTARGLTLRYLIALGLVAFLSIASHFVVKDMLRVSKGSAEIINVSGRQRMLSQRIVGLALELDRGDESARASLKAAIKEFRMAHVKLLDFAKVAIDSPAAEARLRDTYFGAAGTDHAMQLYLAAADRIADSSRKTGQPQYDADLALLQASARGPLLEALEQVVTIHQSVSEERTERLVLIQRLLVAVVVITLQIEALFIFRPMVRDISGYVRQLMDLADRDYLTGLANRRAFSDKARIEILRARRHRHPLSIILVDADYFKQINDMHGHLVGDAVLVALAHSLEAGARQEDVVGRIGGEEFAVLLPETSLPQAREVAERLRRSMAGCPIQAHGKSVEVTVSIGMASVPLDAADPLTAALGTADAMLYKAKESGRNCVWPKLTRVDTESASQSGNRS
ncbi:diguanylate cyclase [Novosphingobium album (ex Hu et al. 2023)]|uniref:diguanylate cyclase n=1 Tax=Novosphingobium album (ex Hu et al. 2023) TaxID=2930093 RepID=A0ABT0AXX7_9SPHN|nr:diguanylate cyclase [Novosphingobium album (ex Hu et al. 2023)]MCJ2177636.1 diguanylate cyclase [Novosphingobium album (ex Hu et al. 2023)]